MCCVLIDIHVLLFPLFSPFHSLRKSIFLLLSLLFFISFFLLVAPGPAAINLLMMQQHTYYLLSFVQFCSHTFFYSHAFIFFSLALTIIAPYSLFSLALSPHTRRSNFLHVCVFSLFSSFLHFCVCVFLY